MIRIGMVSLVVLCLAGAGCASYYIVKDPASGKAYYTKDIEKAKGGTVFLKDEKTGAEVTLQNSEIREVGEDEYKAGLKTPSSAEPAK